MGENIEKLTQLFSDQNMSNEEKLEMLAKQLNNKDKSQMEDMLKNGCSIEEVIGHFMNRSMSPSREKSSFAKNIERLSEGKDLSETEMLNLIQDNLDQESVDKMNEMLSKGYSKEDVINHFLKNAKTKDEQMKETADKIKALMSDNSMTDKDKLEILRNQLSKEDVAQMEVLLKDGGSINDVMCKILKSKSTDSMIETELSKAVYQLIDGRDLSKEDILDIIKSQMDDDSKKELTNMIQRGMSPQAVIDHFMSNGKTITEKRKEVSQQILSLISNTNSTPKEKLEMINSVLLPADQQQIKNMLASGCSIEEVIAHFSDRSVGESFDTELASQIKKLSNGKPLAPEQILELIKSQLGTAGKAKLKQLQDKGYNAQDIVEHFLKSGIQNEASTIGDKISGLIDTSCMSNEEILNIMNSNLNEMEKKIMNDLLQQGKSIEEVIAVLSKTPQ